MEWILWGGMAAMVAAFYALARFGRAAARPSGPEPEFASRQHPPRVCVIVPLSGSDRRMGHCLESVLSQDYPDYEVLLVTRSRDEAAAAMARRVLEHRPTGARPCCRHIAGGPASSRGQKNHGLLAGIDVAANDREIFVFLDAARETPPTWLSNLTGPIARGETAVTTGYHHILPAKAGLPFLGRAVTVLFLQHLQETGWLTQPWGGNMAVSKNAFEELGVRAVWERNVVDDVSLAAILAQNGKKAKFVPGAQLCTPLENETLGNWCRWLTRQLLYLKFCLPGSWMIAGLLACLSAILPAAAIVRIAAASTGMLPAAEVLPDAVLLCLLLGTAFAWKTSHPSPGPPLRWLAASFATIFVAAFCHMKTLFARRILWRGILYTVSRGGCVEEIRDPGDEKRQE
ncbi:MAG: glycosyltransferase family 2 protein [Syntrophobacteraceae bacterium]